MLSLPRFLGSLVLGSPLGVASCFPISTIEFIPSKDSLKVIEKEKIFDGLTFLNAEMNATAESIGSAGLVIPVDFRGNIENGESNKELKDALQISLSSSSGKQSDIQANNLTINTTNNTTLSGSHIGAESGTISTGKLTEKELVHQGFQIAQRLDDGRDMWGQYRSAGNGVITLDGVIGLITSPTIQNIDKHFRLDDFKLKGDMSFSKATHQSSISQGVDIQITNTNKPSSEIKRGEAQSQTQMQITKTQTKNTDIKTLIKDIQKIFKGKQK